MPSAFVPFLASGGKPAAPAALNVGAIAESASAANSFAALMPAAAPTAAKSGCAHTPQNAAKPVVTLQRDGDRVTHIRIQCDCGGVIELECAY